MSKQNAYPKTEILGVEIDVMTIRESIDYIDDFLTKKPDWSIYIVKPYVEFMTRANHDKAIRDLLNQAELSLADGVSLQWAASFLHGQPDGRPTAWKLIKSAVMWIQKPSWRQQIIHQRGAGVDATVQLLKRAETKGWRVGIVGGPKDTESTREALTGIFPELALVGVWSGFFDEEGEARLVEELRDLEIDILIVARGFPIQEEFITRNLDRKIARILIGEGGSFDYDQLGGHIKRAPKFMRSIGLEWLWRLIRQPSRIGRIMAVPSFTWQVYQRARRQK